jgi:Hypothetical glycosyl hydrolase family 15
MSFGRSNLLTAIAFVCVATAGLLWLAAGSAPRESAAAAANSPVRVAWFYNAPGGTSVSEVASKVDDVILTGDTGAAYLKQLRAAGYQGRVFNYVYAFGVSNHPQAWMNQLCRGGEFPALPENFFLHDGNGNRLSRDNSQGAGSRMFAINPGDSAFRRWAIDRMRWMVQTWGYDGIFLDEVWGYSHLVQHWGNQTGSLREFPNAEAFKQAWRSFLTQIRQELGVPLYANTEVLEDYDQSVDGSMIEHWASGWVGGPAMTPARIEQIWSRLDATGKGAVLVTQGDRANTDLMRFGLATYLMVARPGISFRYTTYMNNGYAQLWWYGDYEARLGQPVGARQRVSGSVWQRQFAGGSVRVDLASRSVQIEYSAEPRAAPQPAPSATPATARGGTTTTASAPKSRPRREYGGRRMKKRTIAQSVRRQAAYTGAYVTWGGSAFRSASDLRRHIESQNVQWGTFLRRHPAAAARLGLGGVRWRGPKLLHVKADARS